MMSESCDRSETVSKFFAPRSLAMSSKVRAFRRCVRVLRRAHPDFGKRSGGTLFFQVFRSCPCAVRSSALASASRDWHQASQGRPGRGDSSVILRDSGVAEKVLSARQNICLRTSDVGAGTFARLRWAERDIFDAAAFSFLVLVECGQRSGRNFHIAGDALGELPSQHRSALILDKTVFREALPDE